mgnify:CR=1 FL=1
MTTRRKLIFGTAVLLAAGSWAGVASAASDELLADLLYGVTDALTREYIREHYREGCWDGHRWYYDGRWYSRDAYRRFLAESAAASHRPPPPPPPASRASARASASTGASRTPSGRTGRSRLRSPISPSTRFFRHASRRPIPAIRFGTSSTPFNRPRQPAAGFLFGVLFRTTHNPLVNRKINQSFEERRKGRPPKGAWAVSRAESAPGTGENISGTVAATRSATGTPEKENEPPMRAPASNS